MDNKKQFRIAYSGKAKNLNLKSIYLTIKFGREVEQLESGDFSKQ